VLAACVFFLLAGCGGTGESPEPTAPTSQDRVTNAQTEAETDAPALPGTFLAQVKVEVDIYFGAGPVTLLLDDVLWINGDDLETLKKYGIDPDDVTIDYALVNENEEWVPFTAAENATFRMMMFDGENSPHIYASEMELADFVELMYIGEDHSSQFLAEVTIEDGKVLRVEEVWVP
jgi:hypothetical protein